MHLHSTLKIRIKMEEYKDEINLGDNVVKKLKGIYDPEIPVDIYELGLIYDVMINEDNDVKILMTLTSPNCPVAETLPPENAATEITLVVDPVWGSSQRK